MPCQSIKSLVTENQTLSKINDNGAPNLRKNFLENKKMIKKLHDHCKRMGEKKVVRLAAEDVKYKDYLQLTGIVSECPPTISSTKIKIYPLLISSAEMERIQNSSKFQSPEDKLKEKMRIEEEAKRAKDASEKRKALFKKLDEKKEKVKNQIEKPDEDENELDFIKESKLKTKDKVFMFKQEQEEEIKKVNRIILNAKCNAIREAQLQLQKEKRNELREEEIKLEKNMLNIDRKFMEEDEKRVDKIKLNRQKYAEDIKKQLELKENINKLEIEQLQEEVKVKSVVLEKLVRDETSTKKIAKEKNYKLHKELDEMREICKKLKKYESEKEMDEELKVQQYWKQRAERDRHLKGQLKLAKEVVDKKKEMLYEAQQKSILLKSKLEELASRRDFEQKEREYRRKEKENLEKKLAFKKEFIKAQEEQINEKRRRLELEKSKNDEIYMDIMKNVQEKDKKIKEMEEKRSKMRKKYNEDIIQQISQKETKRHNNVNRSRNEYNAWKEKEEERERNIKLAIQMKLKEVKESSLPEKFINELEVKLLNNLSPV